MGIPPRKSAVAKAAPKKLEEEVDEETVAQVDKAKAKGAKLASTGKKAPPPPKEEEEDRDFRTLHLHSIDDLERPMDGEKANAILYKEVAKFLNSSDHYLLPRFRNDYSATMMYEVNIILWCMGEIG